MNLSEPHLKPSLTFGNPWPINTPHIKKRPPGQLLGWNHGSLSFFFVDFYCACCRPRQVIVQKVSFLMWGVFVGRGLPNVSDGRRLYVEFIWVHLAFFDSCLAPSRSHQVIVLEVPFWCEGYLWAMGHQMWMTDRSFMWFTQRFT
jgi:hypothetical protein